MEFHGLEGLSYLTGLSQGKCLVLVIGLAAVLMYSRYLLTHKIVHKTADGKTEEARVYEYTGNIHRYHF
jgi:hypothetical protein